MGGAAQLNLNKTTTVFTIAKDLLENDNKRKRIEDGIRNFAAPDSADRIASEVIRLAEE